MPLTFAPLTNAVDGNLVVGGGSAPHALHTATYNEFVYLFAVNALPYEQPLTVRVSASSGHPTANLVMSVIPDSAEQLVLDGMPVAPGTSVSFAANGNVAVYGHALMDI